MTLRAALRSWRAPALLLALAAALAGAAAFHYYHRGKAPAAEDRRAEGARFMSDLMAGKGPIGGPFTLTDPHGNPRNLSEFRGRLVLLYFGYTYCPDVCPTDMFAIGQATGLLEADGIRVQPVFITLDPERDTRKAIGAYAASFHPGFVALTGSVDEVGRVARSYKVFFEKFTPPGASAYLIDHMAFTFLLDGEGRYVGLFPPGTPARRMAALVREHFEAGAVEKPGS